MAKKNLCGVEIEYAEDKGFHNGMFHCYGATTVEGKHDPNDKTNNFVTVESEDGKCAKVIAMCPDFDDAKAIVCAMGIAKKLMDAKVGSLNDILENARSGMGERLRKEGYDIEMMENKMKELLDSGKSTEEIMKYMTEHRSDFCTKKPDAKPTDDSKERW